MIINKQTKTKKSNNRFLSICLFFSILSKTIVRKKRLMPKVIDYDKNLLVLVIDYNKNLFHSLYWYNLVVLIIVY